MGWWIGDGMLLQDLMPEIHSRDKLKANNRAVKMTKWVKALPAKPEDLSLLARTPMVKGEKKTTTKCPLTSTHLL